MKVKVLETAFYNNALLEEGEIIDFKGKKLPNWATLADGIQTKKSEKETGGVIPPVKTETKTETEGKTEGEGVKTDADVDNSDEVTNKNETVQEGNGESKKETSDIEQQEYLELLINEGIEKGVLIEDADKKTVAEQIAELEEKLNKTEGK